MTAVQSTVVKVFSASLTTSCNGSLHQLTDAKDKRASDYMQTSGTNTNELSLTDSQPSDDRRLVDVKCQDSIDVLRESGQDNQRHVG